MKRPLCTTLLMLWLAAGQTTAQETNAPAAVTTNATEEIAGTMMILRDPFWPVGYVPAPPEPEISAAEAARLAQEAATEAKIEWPALHLKGITRAGRHRYMAIIDAIGLVEAGQTVSLQRGDMLYTWMIDEVTAKGVLFKRLEARPYKPPTTEGRTQ